MAQNMLSDRSLFSRSVLRSQRETNLGSVMIAQYFILLGNCLERQSHAPQAWTTTSPPKRGPQAWNTSLLRGKKPTWPVLGLPTFAGISLLVHLSEYSFVSAKAESILMIFMHRVLNGGVLDFLDLKQPVFSSPSFKTKLYLPEASPWAQSCFSQDPVWLKLESS